MPWQIVSAWAAVATVAIGLGVHALRYAYTQGKTDQRLAVLEKGQGDIPPISHAIATLTAAVELLQKTADRLDRAVEAVTGRQFETVARARSPRSRAEA